MGTGAGEPEGLGSASGSQPGFEPARAIPVPQNPVPQNPVSQNPVSQNPVSRNPGPLDPAQQNWAPPDQTKIVAGRPPTRRRPRQLRRPRVRLVAAALAGSLVLIGILSALPLLPVGPAPVQQASTPLPLVTETPSEQPGTSSTATSGGNLATPVDFRSGPASGTLLVHAATWTDTGEMAPEAGRRYLILDVTVSCASGPLPVDAVLFLAGAPNGQELPAFGPKLANQLGGRLLEAGESTRGELGYSLAPGEVTLRLLDTDLRPVAEVRIPAP